MEKKMKKFWKDLKVANVCCSRQNHQNLDKTNNETIQIRKEIMEMAQTEMEMVSQEGCQVVECRQCNNSKLWIISKI